MRQELIMSISGANIYTNYGRRTAIGNADHKVGDWVWVDGNCVFGHKVEVQDTPYIPQDNVFLECYPGGEENMIYRLSKITADGRKIKKDNVDSGENKYYSTICYNDKYFAVFVYGRDGLTVKIYNKGVFLKSYLISLGSGRLSNLAAYFEGEDLFFEFCTYSNLYGFDSECECLMMFYKNDTVVESIDFSGIIRAQAQQLKSHIESSISSRKSIFANFNNMTDSGSGTEKWYSHENSIGVIGNTGWSDLPHRDGRESKIKITGLSETYAPTIYFDDNINANYLIDTSLSMAYQSIDMKNRQISIVLETATVVTVSVKEGDCRLVGKIPTSDGGQEDVIFDFMAKSMLQGNFGIEYTTKKEMLLTSSTVAQGNLSESFTTDPNGIEYVGRWGQAEIADNGYADGLVWSKYSTRFYTGVFSFFSETIYIDDNPQIITGFTAEYMDRYKFKYVENTKLPSIEYGYIFSASKKYDIACKIKDSILSTNYLQIVDNETGMAYDVSGFFSQALALMPSEFKFSSNLGNDKVEPFLIADIDKNTILIYANFNSSYGRGNFLAIYRKNDNLLTIYKSDQINNLQLLQLPFNKARGVMPKKEL